jgi:hypothetical protein
MEYRSILTKMRVTVSALSEAYFGEHYEQTENVRL